MSATIPLTTRAELRPHELFAHAWAMQRSTPTPTQPRGVLVMLAALRRRLRVAWSAWRDRRAIRATRFALMNLDNATLRDLGFARAEINSVAAEMHGGVAVTRVRLLACSGPIAH